ncbi:GntR family transcriptional regulator [Pseudoclavibacter sp. AY1F1]|uniref:GntR family transcriptional regulator n=1 Tax=Pseudoclavibacter sp. AY1F1 TaxID=2080583 RepID=UPI000CE8B5DB|nr:GntR family transcriptional regulator [Pseudoclavibacter sp. AY1F1]PPF42847.1 GntR family transcriptional regulator [Pseudoclavibacter sp. AY1F1]
MLASDRVYAVLREEILAGALPPGAVLTEVEQSSRLAVSRTPVRGAFTRLLADGLVRSQSPRVLVVSEISADRVVQLYELREALETQAAALAAMRRDADRFEPIRIRLLDAPRLLELGEEGIADYFELVDALDRAIDEAAASEYLSVALESCRLHSSRVRRLSRHNPVRLREAASEHLGVVDAILANDPRLASHATHFHLHRSLTTALASLEPSASQSTSPEGILST